MMMKKWMAIPMMVLALCTACLQGKVYHHYEHTPLTGWDKTDSLPFNVPPIAKGGLYATDLGLRTTSDYPFTTVTLIVNQRAIPSNKQRTDTVTCKLMDSKGNIKGKGVSFYQYRINVSQMAISDSDSLHITVNHYMKRDILPGIADVGIAVRKLK